METKLEKLFESIEKGLEKNALPVQQNFRAVLLLSYVIRTRLNLKAINLLVKNSLHSECAPLLRAQAEMRLSTLILSGPEGEYAVRWLQWHEEMRSRLKFLKLTHLQAELPHMSAILTQTKKPEDNHLLEEWYRQKPQSEDPDENWLNYWPLWSLEKLVEEVQKHMVESPRVRKEIANLTNFTFEHPANASLTAMKRYALFDDELNSVTYLRTGEIDWAEGPLAMAVAASVDMLSDISLSYKLNLEGEIEAYRLRHTPEAF